MTPPLAVCAACAVGERGPPDGLHLSQHQPGASSHFHLHVPLSVSVKIIIVSKGINNYWLYNQATDINHRKLFLVFHTYRGTLDTRDSKNLEI